MSATSSAVDLSATARRADALALKLGRALLASPAAAHSQHDAASVRAHLQAVLRAMPTSNAAQVALRTYMLEEEHMEAAVSVILGLRDSPEAAAASSRPAPPALFSSADYAQALEAINDADSTSLDAFLPLLLPSGAPADVASALLRRLISQAKQATTAASVMSVLALPLGGRSAAAVQHRLELLLQLARSLPLHPSCVLPIAALIDSATVQASSATLSPAATRRVQHVLASMLVEESRRRSASQWAGAEQMSAYVSRVRSVLRSVPHEHPFTVSYVGELMYMQYTLNALRSYVQEAARAQKLAAAAAATAAAAKSKKSSSSKRSRSRSPAPSASKHSIPLFDSPPALLSLFSALLGEVARQLGTGHRQPGDVESELVRFAVLIRSIESAGLSAAGPFGGLVRLAQQHALSFPARPIPLTLRPSLQRFGTALQHCKQLWSLADAPTVHASATQARLSLPQLQKVLVQLDGKLMADDDEEEEAEEGKEAAGQEESSDDEEEDAPASKRARASNSFDAFGVARDANESFFTSSHAAAPVAAAASSASESKDGSEDAAAAKADDDAAAAGGVQASMSRIIDSLPQPTRPVRATRAKGGKKAAAAAAAAVSSEDAAAAVEAEAAESDLARAIDAEVRAAGGVPALPPADEGVAIDLDIDMEAAAEGDDAAPPVKKESKTPKKGAKTPRKAASKAAKQEEEGEEEEEAPAAPTTTGRSKRAAAKPKK